jgi:hypothetical protein
MAQASPSSARGTERGSWSRLPKALAARFDSILALKEQPWYSFSQLNRPPSFPKPHYVLYARLNALTRRRPTRWPPAQRDCWAPFQLTRQAAILFRKCRDNFMKRARKGSKGTSHPKLLRRASVAATISQMGARIRSDRTGDATAMISVLKPVAVSPRARVTLRAARQGQLRCRLLKSVVNAGACQFRSAVLRSLPLARASARCR